ncbi:putative domain HDIG-containing protein [Desulfitobacterium dichloroeliminans LMG P-21439]|uniref:Putative domain HDIG-containing protein n=1 Tax=Desulfitobacterium dichloroeliminans (strain LMG P-21439 / DCA1) TaxID=871963 RepID=L0FBW6_DESDL|nr:HDIG domain-containing metalloprotein [Desulfitobacterium dichloroeliminans]AGA70712.1 putative domain HDIG-containing protein [Desulfitobacterium dichloroeliminans LMG P-21439]
MSNYAQDREAAWQLLNEYVKSETLLRHSLTVEAVMRHFATLYLEDPNIWGNIGLLHDIDYEMYPDQHCRKTREILTPKELSDEFIRAIESHGYGLVHHVEPRENVEKVLFTIDELTGLISATALLRPSKSIHDLTTKSVKKKWKQKSFAENVNREVIEEGANRLGKDLEEIIEETIKGMRNIAVAIGLEGNVEAAQEAGK